MSLILDSYSPLTFTELQTEFYARGYNYLDRDDAGRARAKRWLNQAYASLCSAMPWPFLEVTVEAEAPLELEDLGQVLSVSTGGIPLEYVEESDLVHDGVDFTTRAQASYFYVNGNSVTVWPIGDEIVVRYRRSPEELVDDDHGLVVPRRYMDLIVDGAVIKALKDADNYEAAAELQAMYDRELAGMADHFFPRSTGTSFVTLTGAQY